MSIQSLIKKIANACGLEIQRTPSFAFMNDDQEFSRMLAQASVASVVDRQRLLILYGIARHVQSSTLAGDVAECGVYRGGTASLFSNVFSADASVSVHLFDTFEGMPEVNPAYDKHKKGDFSDTSLSGVQKFLQDSHNVTFHKGLFSETFSDVKENKFRFVHIDCDIYSSVKECCEFFYPRMVTGGAMIFDDYGFASCPGAKKAADEFFSDKKEYLIRLPTKQALVIKQ